MKALMFKIADVMFLVNLEDLLHVSLFEEYDESEGLTVVDLSDYLDGNSNKKYILFVTNNKTYVGIICDEIYDILEYNEYKPFEKGEKKLDFLKGVVTYKDNLIYLLDAEKLIEVAYEKDNVS
ncbi:chemotaxis protein CheW [Deferribacter thermophilus]|uniref:chemotaxis protein CheW n=1 Tax=Deferribacter thermophilus TaxID=53573 RepID=UPI003C1654B7